MNDYGEIKVALVIFCSRRQEQVNLDNPLPKHLRKRFKFALTTPEMQVFCNKIRTFLLESTLPIQYHSFICLHIERPQIYEEIRGKEEGTYCIHFWVQSNNQRLRENRQQ